MLRYSRQAKLRCNPGNCEKWARGTTTMSTATGKEASECFEDQKLECWNDDGERKRNCGCAGEEKSGGFCALRKQSGKEIVLDS